MDCPECGAMDAACEARYHECLAKEFSEAGYGAVHHLTVATYMLQHSSKLTKEGWLYERNLLKEFLIEKKSPGLVRRQSRDLVDDGRRKFKITSKDGKPKISLRKWSKTILDVRLENAGTYCQDVTAWARLSLQDVENTSPE